MHPSNGLFAKDSIVLEIVTSEFPTISETLGKNSQYCTLMIPRRPDVLGLNLTTEKNKNRKDTALAQSTAHNGTRYWTKNQS